MIPIEHHYVVEQPKYVIVEYFLVSFFEHLQVFLIKNTESKKFNCYVLECFELRPYCKNAERVVLNFSPVSLEIAQKEFPEYNFTDENYGF